MEPILLSPCIYVLELEDDCRYVGITMNLNLRWAQHCGGTGAKWTRLHKPIRILEVIFSGAGRAMEDEVTRRYMELCGAEKVRGGSWCRTG
jgi:predicted GIY-YIG superfamily endonuclease